MLSLNFTALRFPIVFGSFLVLAGTAFIFRDDLMPNLDEAKKTLNKHDEFAKRELEDMIKSIKK